MHSSAGNTHSTMVAVDLVLMAQFMLYFFY